MAESFSFCHRTGSECPLQEMESRIYRVLGLNPNQTVTETTVTQSTAYSRALSIEQQTTDQTRFELRQLLFTFSSFIGLLFSKLFINSSITQRLRASADKVHRQLQAWKQLFNILLSLPIVYVESLMGSRFTHLSVLSVALSLWGCHGSTNPSSIMLPNLGPESNYEVSLQRSFRHYFRVTFIAINWNINDSLNGSQLNETLQPCRLSHLPLTALSQDHYNITRSHFPQVGYSSSSALLYWHLLSTTKPKSNQRRRLSPT